MEQRDKGQHKRGNLWDETEYRSKINNLPTEGDINVFIILEVSKKSESKQRDLGLSVIVPDDSYSLQ